MTLTVPSKVGHQTFLYSQLQTDLDNLNADIAFLGIPYGSAYTFADIVNDQTHMPYAMRQATDRILRSVERHDFDLGGPLYDNRPIRAVDCGDIAPDFRDLNVHKQRAEQAVRRILDSGALPIIMGGDHGITIPALRAYENHGPLTLVHIDQHLDWRDSVNGVRDGLSSPIRRASEMPHVKHIIQIGLRASGSARTEEVEAALAWGSKLVTAYDLHDRGMDAVLDMIPDGGRYYISVDLDGMDPSIAPAVAGACPGGVTLPQMRKLIHGLVKKGRVVGMDVVEIIPASDVNQITCITAGQMIVNLIGAAVRAGYFDR